MSALTLKTVTTPSRHKMKPPKSDNQPSINSTSLAAATTSPRYSLGVGISVQN